LTTNLPGELFDKDFDSIVEAKSQQLKKFTKEPTRKRKSKNSVGPSDWETALASAESAMISGDWSEQRSLVFVAAYAVLHKEMYGIDASELSTGAGRKLAERCVLRTMQQEFHSDPNLFADYLRWVMIRETALMKKYEDRRRLVWQSIFTAGYLLTEWRIQRSKGSP
jgi:hypothetical protein